MARKKIAVEKAAHLKQDVACFSWPVGIKQTATGMVWFDRLSKCPPGLSRNELAIQLGLPYASVAAWTKKLAYRYRIMKRGRKSVVDWQGVDWSQRNCQIAESLGVSGERVRQVRFARKASRFGMQDG